MAWLVRLDAARTISAAASLLALMVLGGLIAASLSGGVHREAWLAAATVPIMVAAGLLYAWRLGAYGEAR